MLYSLRLLFFVSVCIAFTQFANAQSNTTLNCLYNNNVDLLLENQSVGSNYNMKVKLLCQPNQTINKIDTAIINVAANDNCGLQTGSYGIQIDEHISQSFKYLDITLNNQITIEAGLIIEGIIRFGDQNSNLIECNTKYKLQFNVHERDTLNNNLHINYHNLLQNY